MDLLTVQDWAKTMHTETQDSDHGQAIDALASMLKDEASPADTAKTITAAYERFLKGKPTATTTEADGGPNKVVHFWVFNMCDAIRNLGNPSSTERLVELLCSISKQPDVHSSDESVVKHKESSGQESVYWRDLPGWISNFMDQCLCKWVWQFRHAAIDEEIIDLDHISDFYSEEMDDYFARGQQVLNATGFAARLFERGLYASELHQEAALAIKDGIEQPFDEHNKTKSQEELRYLLPIAATWLLIAGKKIYSISLANSLNDAEWSIGRREDQWGWCKQRWELWHHRLQRLANSEDIDDACRDFASRAARKMADIEV